MTTVRAFMVCEISKAIHLQQAPSDVGALFHHQCNQLATPANTRSAAARSTVARSWFLSPSTQSGAWLRLGIGGE